MNKYFSLNKIKVVIIANKPLYEYDYKENINEYVYSVYIPDYGETYKKELILKLWKLSRDKHKIMHILNIRSDISAIKELTKKALTDSEFKFKLYLSKGIDIQTYMDNWGDKLFAIWGEMKKQDKINFRNYINSRII
jgi:hypothetical protein